MKSQSRILKRATVGLALLLSVVSTSSAQLTDAKIVFRSDRDGNREIGVFQNRRKPIERSADIWVEKG